MQLRTECFVCHNLGQIIGKCPEKSNSRTSSSQTTQAKKVFCYTQKVTKHPNSKTKVGQALASCLVKSRPKNSLVTSVIINSGATDLFFCNRDLSTIYREYENEFQTGTGQKIAAHCYGNVHLRLSDHEGNITILTVTKVSWAAQLGHNLLNTIPLANKGIEVFLRKVGQPSEIIADDKRFRLADMIWNQYVIRLAENPRLVTFN